MSGRGIAEKWTKVFEERRKETLDEAERLKEHFFGRSIRVLGVSASMRDRHDMAQQDSTTEWLLNHSLDEAKGLGAETKLLQLRKYDIRPCKACYSTSNAHCHFKCTCYPEGERGDDMTNKIYDMCSWADAVLFATPVNNFKISSLMALFIDRLISMDGSLKPADPADPKNRELNIAHTEFIEKHGTEEFGSGFLHRFTGKVAGIIVSGHEAGASLAISSLFLTLNHYGFAFPPFGNMYAMGTVCDNTATDKGKLESPCYEREARLLARNVVTAARVLKRKGDYWWAYEGSAD